MTMTPHHCTPVLFVWCRCRQPRPSHVQSVEEAGVHRRSLTAIPAKVPQCFQSRVAGPEEWRPTAEVLRALKPETTWLNFTQNEDLSDKHEDLVNLVNLVGFSTGFQPFCPCRLPDFEAQDDLEDRKERWSQRAPASVPSVAAGATAGWERWRSK